MTLYYIKEAYSSELYHSKAFDFYFKNLNFGVLDIETTGLNATHAAFILGGLISYNDKCFEQFFVENISEEKLALEAFLHRLKDFDVILTYNGQNFDVPFLLKRAKILGLEVPANLPYNLDLYLVLNNHSSLRKFLPNLKQKTVENFMGLWTDRLDEISGKESIVLYFDYLRTRDTSIRQTILLHNSDDVKQLSKLLPILEKADLHKAMHSLGYLVKPSWASTNVGKGIEIKKIGLNGKELTVAGRQGGLGKNYTSFGNDRSDFTVNFNETTDSFQFSIPLQSFDCNLYVDMRRLLNNFQELEKYAFFEKDFLILKVNDQVNYLEVNHFIRLFLDRLGEI